MKLWKKIGLGLGALVAAPFLAPVLAGLGASGLGAVGLGGTGLASSLSGIAAGAGAVGSGVGGAAAVGTAPSALAAFGGGGSTLAAGSGLGSSLATGTAAAKAALPGAIAKSGANAAAPKIFDKLGIHGKGSEILQSMVLPGLLGYATGGATGALGMPLLAAQMKRNGQSSAMPMLGGLLGRAMGGKAGGLQGMGLMGLLPSLLDPMPKAPSLGPALTTEEALAQTQPAGVDDIFGNPLTRGQPTLDSLFGKSF